MKTCLKNLGTRTTVSRRGAKIKKFAFFFVPRENHEEDRGRLYSESYDTKYAKSFRHFTREALPRMENYRNIMSIHAAYRPTLDELHDATLHGKVCRKIGNPCRTR